MIYSIRYNPQTLFMLTDMKSMKARGTKNVKRRESRAAAVAAPMVSKSAWEATIEGSWYSGT